MSVTFCWHSDVVKNMCLAKIHTVHSIMSSTHNFDIDVRHIKMRMKTCGLSCCSLRTASYHLFNAPSADAMYWHQAYFLYHDLSSFSRQHMSGTAVLEPHVYCWHTERLTLTMHTRHKNLSVTPFFLLPDCRLYWLIAKQSFLYCCHPSSNCMQCWPVPLTQVSGYRFAEGCCLP